MRASGQIPEPTLPAQLDQPIIQQPHALDPLSRPDTGLAKRKFPGAWSNDEMKQGMQSNSLYRPENNQHGFTSASSLYHAQGIHPPEGFSFATRSEPWPHTRFPNRPVVPLPGMSQHFDRAVTSVNPSQDLVAHPYDDPNAAAMTEYGYHGGDFNTNYGEGEQAIRGVTAGPADLEKRSVCSVLFLYQITKPVPRFKDFMHRALEEFKDVTSVTDAQKKLNMQTENDLLDGMRVRLLPHQIIGVAWMVAQVSLKV